MNQCSVNHVFLTGKKQIGKSTFLKKVLAVYPKCPAGFYTVRTNAFLETSYSVHLFSAKLPEKQRIPTEENLLFLLMIQSNVSIVLVVPHFCTPMLHP